MEDIMEDLPYEDIRAFEQRLTELISAHRPSDYRRHKLLAIIVLAISMFWYIVPRPMPNWLQTVLTIATILLILPIVMDYRKPKLAPEIIASQTRSLLEFFDMSCDDDGKLILNTPSNIARENN